MTLCPRGRASVSVSRFSFDVPVLLDFRTDGCLSRSPDFPTRRPRPPPLPQMHPLTSPRGVVECHIHHYQPPVAPNMCFDKLVRISPVPAQKIFEILSGTNGKYTFCTITRPQIIAWPKTIYFLGVRMA